MFRHVRPDDDVGLAPIVVLCVKVCVIVAQST